jgi:hypothetical protein
MIGRDAGDDEHKAEPDRLARELLAEGKFWLERGEQEPAMEALIACFRLGYRKRVAWRLLRERCYRPHQERFRNNYLKNAEALYGHPDLADCSFPPFEQLRYWFIPYSSTRLAVYDRALQDFTGDLQMEPAPYLKEVKESDLFLLDNEMHPWNIIAIEEKSREANSFLWKKTPLYLYYDDFNKFVPYLQLGDLTPALSGQRLVFLFGREKLDRYFDDSQAMLPAYVLWFGSDEINTRVTDKVQRTREQAAALKNSVYDVYATISRQDLLESLQSGKPRILFYTSRFTTALQYYARDCALACDRLGIPNMVLKERSDLHRINLYTFAEALHDFRPDIIFCIDHFRWEEPFLPDNIIYLTWAQDPLPHILSKESAARIGPLDFVLNAFVSDVKMLLQLGYPPESIIEAPIVGNDDIYKPRRLSQPEREQYAADVGAFSNAGNPAAGLAEVLRILASSTNYGKLTTALKSAYWQMYRNFYREEFIYSLDDYQKFLLGCLGNSGLSLEAAGLERLAQIWRQEVGWRIVRSLPLEWLHERGYDLKIWGREWVNHPLLAVHAQGVAANGETLSRIINACKIIIGTNPAVTIHPRVFETFLSGSLYMANRIPEQFDMANIRRYLAEDREIIFAHDRADLYRKVDYYLEHEAERRQVVTRAREKIIQGLTYEVLMKRVIGEVAHRFEARL